MITFGSLAFLEPFALTALILLPLIWLIIRALPPGIRNVSFPPLMLLRGLAGTEPPPDRAPPWILVLRLLMATLLIVAFARPVFNKAEDLPGSGPLLVVLDNGWEAASRWRNRIEALRNIAERARRDDRSIILVPSAQPAAAADGGQQFTLTPSGASDLLDRLSAIVPMPWSPDHRKLAERLRDADSIPAVDRIIWLSDGLEHAGTRQLYAALNALAPMDVKSDEPVRHPLALLAPEFEGLDILLTAVRPVRDYPATVEIEGVAADGRRLAVAEADFDAGEARARVRLSLPPELRNSLSLIRIRGEASAGAAYYLDARASRPAVGIIEDIDPSTPPLKTPALFLARAIGPFAAVTNGRLENLVSRQISILLMADIGRLNAAAERQLTEWVSAGGILIRFAGPRMADDPGPLVPVQLRTGGRAFGGAFTWDSAKHLKPFAETSPFFGLQIPDDVTVTRQLLAAPHPELGDKTWARLEDGTPLVTAGRVGDGRIILFHTSANAEWSNLAISGLFVGMLKRTLAFSQSPASGLAENAPSLLAPLSSLDGFGEPASVLPGTPPIQRGKLEQIVAGRNQPPGRYGPEGAAVAVNLASANGPIAARFRFVDLQAETFGVLSGLGAGAELDPVPWLLAFVLLLAIIDLVAARVLKGQPVLPLALAWKRSALLTAALGLIAMTSRSEAQEIDSLFAVDATREARIAWVATGDRRQDQIIEAGLKGLGRVMRIRTAVALGDPVQIDPETDPMELFFLVYWPVPADAVASLRARRNLAEYLRYGGMVLFDTGVGDPAGESLGLQRPEAQQALGRILEGLEVPRLDQVSDNHVLSRSFYLLGRFPGRIRGRALWVEHGSFDGSHVSGVVIGGGDWAAAWALEPNGLPIVRNLPGGEQQRELAFRFGINLTMYALTGTYKDDQLHMPIILDRLGE